MGRFNALPTAAITDDSAVGGQIIKGAPYLMTIITFSTEIWFNWWKSEKLTISLMDKIIRCYRHLVAFWYYGR